MTTTIRATTQLEGACASNYGVELVDTVFETDGEVVRISKRFPGDIALTPTGWKQAAEFAEHLTKLASQVDSRLESHTTLFAKGELAIDIGAVTP